MFISTFVVGAQIAHGAVGDVHLGAEVGLAEEVGQSGDEVEEAVAECVGGDGRVAHHVGEAARQDLLEVVGGRPVF